MTPLDHFVIYKRGKVYYYYVYRNGRKVHRSTGERTKAKAQKRILMRLESGDILSDRCSTLFSEFAQLFWHYETCPIVRDVLARGRSYGREACRTNLQRTAKYLVPRFGRFHLDEITPSDIRQFLYDLDDTGLSHSTINAVLSILRQMLQEAVSRELIQRNPVDSVKPLAKNSRVKGHFTVDEVHRLVSSHCDLDFLPVMVELAATTGMRLGEIMALQDKAIHDDHIDVMHSYAVLSKLKSTKSGHERTVPVLPSTIGKVRSVARFLGSPWIFTINGSEPVSHRTVSDYFKRMMENCGIDHKTRNLSFHSLRHFLNTQLVTAGVQGEKIRAVVGHESEEMTEHYLHLTVSDYQQIRDIQKTLII